MSKKKKSPKGQNRHHLRPKSRGGKRTKENILNIKIDRHHYWHKVFGNMTLDEVIELLQRIKRAKGRT